MRTVDPRITRNCDQSLSIITRIQSGRLVYIAHSRKCAGSPANGLLRDAVPRILYHHSMERSDGVFALVSGLIERRSRRRYCRVAWEDGLKSTGDKIFVGWKRKYELEARRAPC